MGLLLGGMMQGLGAGVIGAADTMERERALAYANAVRHEERKLERDSREEQRRLDREERAQRAADAAELRREIAASKKSSGGSGGGNNFDSAEPGQDENLMAAEMGISVPELREFLKAQGGDTTGFQKDQVVEDESGGHVQKTLPPGFDKFMAERRKSYASAMSKFRFAKGADDVAKARGSEQESAVTGLIAGAQNPEQVQEGARKANAIKGNGEFKGGATGVTNEFTGTQTMNPVGNAQVKTEGSKQAENYAQAGSAKAAAGASNALADKRRAGGDDNVMTNDQLNRAIETARKAEKDARDAGDKVAAQEARERRIRLQAEQDGRVGGKKSEAKAPAPKKLEPSEEKAAAAAAKQAIAKGKDPAAVRARLKEYGIDPSKYGI